MPSKPPPGTWRRKDPLWDDNQAWHYPSGAEIRRKREQRKALDAKLAKRMLQGNPLPPDK